MWDLILLPLKHFFEWAKSDKQYPLLFPFSLIFVYLFVNRYIQTETFKETIDHEYFLIVAAAIFCITGINYALIDFKKRRIIRYSAGGLFCILGFAFIFLVFFQRTSPELPNDKLVISVAEFDYESGTKATKNDSISIQAFIYHELRKRALNGVPITINKPQHLVKFGNGIPDGAIRAKKLGTSRKGAAHIVMWGQLGRYEEKLWVMPIVTICQPFGDIQTREIKINVLFDEPMEFSKRYSSEIADVLTIICGLAFYANGLYGEAITSFKETDRYEAKLLTGMSYLMMANPISCIQAIEGIKPRNIQHKMAINNTLGMAYLSLAQYQHAKDSFQLVLQIDGNNTAALNNLALCDMGLKQYTEAIRKFEKILDEKNNPVVLSNLAFCRFELGDTLKAIEHWEASLKHFSVWPDSPEKKYDILDAKAGLAVGYFDYGKIDQAVSLFKSVTKEDPSYRNPDILKLWTWPDKAISTSQKLLKNMD